MATKPKHDVSVFEFSSRFRVAALALLVSTQLLACAVAAVGAGVAVGAMVMTDRRTSGAQLDDEGIELRSINRLTDTLKGKGHINVTSYNRRVLITGEVGTEAERQLVEKVIVGVDNVRGIVNELAVMPDSSISARTSDTVITGRVKAALMEASLSSNAFKVVTERGVVYLMGRVSNTEADMAANAARAVPGVIKVVRTLEILTLQEQRKLQEQQQAQ